MRFKLTLPFHIRDAERVVETFARHLERCLKERLFDEPTVVLMTVLRETSREAPLNEADTVFVEAFSGPAESEELTLLSTAMVRTSQELKVHGFALRVEPMLSIAA